MHLHNFDIEVWPKDFRGLAREPKERVYTGRIIRGPDDGDLGFKICDFRFFRGGVAGGANHETLFVLRAKLCDRKGCVVETKVYDHITLFNDVAQVVAHIDFPDDLKFRNARRAREEGLSHASFGTS